MSDPVIGIDLGTTNSCAAVVQGDAQNVQLIPYRGGEYTIPSIYAIDEKGNELVGHEAKRQWQLNPKRTVYGSKRLLGKQYDPEVQKRIRTYFSYDILEEKGTTEAKVAVAGQEFTLQEIAAKILQKIKDVASDHLGTPVTKAVVTVPAYFNDRQRQAVKEAGRMIDLEVIRVINEPTAAALAFGVGRGIKNESLAVYDCGGGTFDISVIEVRDRVFEVKATGGDIFLGGVDWDNRVISWVIDEFAKTNSEVNLKNDPIAIQRIRDLAERSKIDLSTRQQVPINIPFVTIAPSGQPLDIDLTLDRDNFETMTSDLVDVTMETCDAVCKEAGIEPTDIDHVLLVGGMTRMPSIQKAVTSFFGKEPSKQVHPDEAVAIGAAMFAYSFQDNSDLRVQVLDVISMAIGIEDATGKMHTIFDRNESIPNLKTLCFTTSVDNQVDLQMRIYQGDKERAKDNEALGEFTFSGIRVGPAGSVRVEVAFSLTQDGILEMSAQDPDTGKQMKTEVDLGVQRT